MKKNVGTTDKAIRIVLGLLIIAAGFYFHSWWGLIGVVLLLTGLFNFCLAYLPFKINTRKSKTSAE